MRYKVTVEFTRLNVNQEREESERYGIFEASSPKEAKEAYLKRFHRNEPNCRNISKVTVKKV